ncbi:MAG: hypothetical protein ACRD2C_00175 [Acidimicrobiales bacterium]
MQNLLVFAVVIVAAGVFLVAVVASIWLLPERDGGTESPPTSRPASPTTAVPTYDVDGDGAADFAVIRDEVVAVPNDSSDGVAAWLQFAGTILAAIVGAAALIGVALLNRQGGEQIDRFAERVDRLEAQRTAEDGR